VFPNIGKQWLRRYILLTSFVSFLMLARSEEEEGDKGSDEEGDEGDKSSDDDDDDDDGDDNEKVEREPESEACSTGQEGPTIVEMLGEKVVAPILAKAGMMFKNEDDLPSQAPVDRTAAMVASKESSRNLAGAHLVRGSP